MLSASAIILAGGQSRRMGQPKATLRFGNSTIVERVLGQLASGFDEVLVIAAPEEFENFPIESMLRSVPSSVRLLRDRNSYQGAALALARGLAAAAHDVVFASSCDLPLLRVEVAIALCAMLNDYDAVIPNINYKPQPLCAVYHRRVAALIDRQQTSGERRLTLITEALRALRLEDAQLRQIDPDLSSFMNINTPEDYDRALATYKARSAE